MYIWCSLRICYIYHVYIEQLSECEKDLELCFRSGTRLHGACIYRMMTIFMYSIRKLSLGQADVGQDEVLPEHSGQHRRSIVASIIF